MAKTSEFSNQIWYYSQYPKKLQMELLASHTSKQAMDICLEQQRDIQNLMPSTFSSTFRTSCEKIGDDYARLVMLSLAYKLSLKTPYDLLPSGKFLSLNECERQKDRIFQRYSKQNFSFNSYLALCSEDFGSPVTWVVKILGTPKL